MLKSLDLDRAYGAAPGRSWN